MGLYKQLRSSVRCFVDYNSIHPYRGNFTGPAAFLHKIAREEKHLYYVKELGRKVPRLPFRTLIQSTLWLLVLVCKSVYQFFHPLRNFKRQKLRYLMDIPKMIAYGWRHNADPMHYYMYLLHQDDQPAEDFDRYQLAWEHHYIGRRIARLRQSDVGALDNKDQFVKFCETHHLPTVPVIDRATLDSKQLKPSDLFAKSALGFGGVGCLLLRYGPSDRTWDLDGTRVKQEQLDEVISQNLETDRYVLQYRIKNHADIRWLSEEVLTTLRIVTAWDPQGQPISLRATIRLPGTDVAYVDNSTQGGLCAPVHPIKGIITGKSVNYRTDFKSQYPLNSARSFIGFQLPLWEEALDLVYRAHRSAGNYNFLGWDLAITDEGVLLTECNVWSHIDLVQVPQESPFLTDEVLDCYRAEPALQDYV